MLGHTDGGFLSKPLQISQSLLQEILFATQLGLLLLDPGFGTLDELQSGIHPLSNGQHSSLFVSLFQQSLQWLSPGLSEPNTSRAASRRPTRARAAVAKSSGLTLWRLTPDCGGTVDFFSRGFRERIFAAFVTSDELRDPPKYSLRKIGEIDMKCFSTQGWPTWPLAQVANA